MSLPLGRKRLPPPTLQSLYPPVEGYHYFESSERWPLANCAGIECAKRRWWLAEHALLAYDSAERIHAVLSSLGFSVHCCGTSMGAFAYAAIAGDEGVLVFRGTQAIRPGDSPRKLKEVLGDWMIDAQFLRERGTDGEVHGGFAKALATLWPQLQPHLPHATRWWCAGHSLGGALAALAALRVHASGVQLAGAMTFGQPRTGDNTLARALERLPILRVVNACDLIPQLPPEALGYAHGGRLAHFDSHHRQSYAQTLKRHLLRLPRNLRHGLGALTPIELIDHAPLYYAVKSYNHALRAAPEEQI